MGQNSDLKIKIEIFTLMLSGFKTLNAATQVATFKIFNWYINAFCKQLLSFRWKT